MGRLLMCYNFDFLFGPNSSQCEYLHKVLTSQLRIIISYIESLSNVPLYFSVESVEENGCKHATLWNAICDSKVTLTLSPAMDIVHRFITKQIDRAEDLSQMHL